MKIAGPPPLLRRLLLILIASCWQGTGWASQIWEVDSHDPSTHTIRWTKGGFQDARASSSGAEWYLE